MREQRDDGRDGGEERETEGFSAMQREAKEVSGGGVKQKK